MSRLWRFVRTTPVAFWLAILGVAFSLGVFFSGVFGEEGPFALIFMAPGFLTVAVLTAFDQPVLRWIATVIAGLMALVFAQLFVGFATHPPITAPLFIHFAGMAIAAVAAVSDFRSARRTRPLTPA
jgi:hypothetical protein